MDSKKYTRQFAKQWVKIPGSKVNEKRSHRKTKVHHKYAVSERSNQKCINLFELNLDFKINNKEIK